MELSPKLVLLVFVLCLVLVSVISKEKRQADGSRCLTRPDRAPGRCLVQLRCIRELRAKRIKPAHSLGQGTCHRRRTCCPNAPQPNVPKQVQAECGEQMNAFTPSILGGRAALPAEWPWLVSISIGFGHDCGGALVTRSHVVTAAHCVIDNGGRIIPSSRFSIRAGLLDLRQLRDGQTLSVSKVTHHPAFNLSVFHADVAVLKLSQPAVLNRQVGLLCLPTRSLLEPLEGKFGAIAGWGDKREGGNGSHTLQTLTSVPIWTRARCSAAYRSALVIDEGMFCAGHEAGGRDSCQGDSGGPLMWFDPRTQRFSLAGVVSTGLGCGRQGFPGVYTSALTYLQWIQQQLR